MGVSEDEMKLEAVLIAGPTASGKSALALEFAERLGGAVINADSMQVYDTLQILTARPDDGETGEVPHHLYGHVPASEAYSTGRWSRDVARLLPDLVSGGQTPIFVGGTGLYFKALLGGLSEMPDIPDTVRAGWRSRLAEQGPAELHKELRKRDPEAADTLNPGDSQRIVRALEVFEATGQSILTLQAKKGEALVAPESVRKILLLPDRSALRERIRDRFERMMQNGAVDEVRALLALNLDPDLPATKAIGVREITAFLNGTLSWEEAIERASIATRQYAKRQSTWFRNQLSADWEIRRD